MRQTVIITFSARPSWGLTLQRYCKTKGVSRSQFIRDAVNIALFKGGGSVEMGEHIGVPHQHWGDLEKEGDKRCNPHDIEGCCPTCWPEGFE